MLGGRGLAVESDLVKTRVKLEEALERVKSVERVVTIDLPYAIAVSFLRLSLTPGLSSVALACLLLIFAGSGGDVEPQVSFSLDGARSDRGA